MFKECETNNSYANSTIGLNLYTIKGTENFAFIDSPGDTEIDENLEILSSKGYNYSKILIYVIAERQQLDARALRKNKKLEEIINMRLKYKIPIIILLTHSDNYCEEVKKSNNNDWKNICKTNIINNKTNLLEYINEIEKKNHSDLKTEENDILHVVLVEPKTKKLTDEEIINLFDEETREEYDNANEEEKKTIIKFFGRGKKSTNNEVKDFLEKEIKVLGKKELAKILKEILPSQYFGALK